jgi:hypothetical protein
LSPEESCQPNRRRRPAVERGHQQTLSLPPGDRRPTDPLQPVGGLIAYAVVAQPGVPPSFHPPVAGMTWCRTPTERRVPAVPGRRSRGFVLGWSSDGTELLTSGSQASPGLVLTDATGTFGDDRREGLVHVPCTGGNGVALSRWSRIAFVRNYGNDHGATVVAILDLARARSVSRHENHQPDPDC